MIVLNLMDKKFLHSWGEEEVFIFIYLFFKVGKQMKKELSLIMRRNDEN